MSPEQRELFRLALLRIAEANDTRYGLSAQAFAIHANPFGFTPALGDTVRELEYLQQKGFLQISAKAISPENRQWKITATGRDELATRG
jgi:hypothetical protein